MKRVIIESPYRGHGESEGEIRFRTQWNVEYARRCVRDSVLRGEAPIASHLLFTQPGILRDEVAEERALGIAAGLAWREVADYSAFYTDRGWSMGMLLAFASLLSQRVNSNFKIRYFTELVKPTAVQLHHLDVYDPLTVLYAVDQRVQQCQ